MPGRHPRAALLIFVCLLVSMILASCAPAASGPGGSAGGGDLAAVQEYRANMGGDPPSLDPNASSWDPSILVISLVFKGLFQFNEDLTLAPAVAKEIPTTANGGISADAKTYTVKLRNDVKWSDGKLVTAKDFEYSVKRMLDPKLAASYASFYHGIAGAEAYNTALGTKTNPKNPDAATLTKLRDAVAVKATDDATIQFVLSDPRPSFLSLLALHPVVPLRQDIIEAKGDKWASDPANYIGNGPFKMTEYVSKDHITLIPNDTYFGTKPKLTKVSLFMVEDINANYAAYQNGERDITRVPVPNVPVVLADPSLKNEVVRAPALATFSIQFNNKMPPFDNPKVRKAFSMAFDRLTYIDKVRRGVGRPAFSWIPPGMPGYQPELGKDWGFDPAKAKQMLADAGYPDGKGLPPVSFQYANSGNNPLTAEFAQAQFKDNLGVDVKLEPMEGAEFSKLVSSNKHMMGYAGWSADYPDPDNWLPEQFGSKGGNNHTQYSNPKLDELMQKAISEPDPKKRLEMWAEAQKMVVDDLPMMFLFNDERFIQVKPYVKGLKLTGIDTQGLAGNYFLSEVYLLKH